MKKKIKDLTLEELKKICKNKKCSECILFTFVGFYSCKIRNYLEDAHNIAEYENQEIEVDVGE